MLEHHTAESPSLVSALTGIDSVIDSVAFETRGDPRVEFSHLPQS
jgi:hypothetical protein